MRLTPAELLVLFAIGAVGGLVGDAGHVQSHTTRYLDHSVPFIWESAIWFCLAVGLATAALAELRLRLGPSRPGFDLRVGLAAIAAVLALYAVTAIVHDEPEGPATTLVAALVVLIACWLGGGRPALACGLAAAIVGPLAEAVIVESELSEYAPSSDSLLGVPLWLPALYFAFGFVVARLAELAVARRGVPAPRPDRSP